MSKIEDNSVFADNMKDNITSDFKDNVNMDQCCDCCAQAVADTFIMDKAVPFCKQCCDKQYYVKLPEFHATFHTALQHEYDNSAYVTFDPDTQHCVVDNCANVHIWNDFSAFIPSSYMKINEASSTAVSAVNGDSNLPAGCGDVPVSWKDDNGKEYHIVLKNVLHFSKSPVKILSVVQLAEQLQDDLDTWILSRIFQSIFT